MALTKEKIFDNAQIEYLNNALAPDTVDTYIPIWEARGRVEINNYVDLSKETEESIDSLLTLFILYTAFTLHPTGEGMRVNLNNALKAAKERQVRDAQKTTGKAIFKGDIESAFKEVNW